MREFVTRISWLDSVENQRILGPGGGESENVSFNGGFYSIPTCKILVGLDYRFSWGGKPCCEYSHHTLTFIINFLLSDLLCYMTKPVGI